MAVFGTDDGAYEPFNGVASLDFPEFKGFNARPDFVTYINEAAFFWQLLKPLLVERGPIDVCEVGSGAGLLSLMASTVVKNLTSVDSGSAGFNQMPNFRKALLSMWDAENPPVFFDSFLHNLPPDQTFDFIFCINVLEHVPQTEDLIDEIYLRLNPGGMAWFVLPNYSFPYEQHFDVPIIFTKRITERIFGERIRNHKGCPDPLELWAELSWPTQGKLQSFLRTRGWSFEFRKSTLLGYFERLGEPIFLKRKGPFFRSIAPLLRLFRPLIVALPSVVTPVIDLTVSKPVCSLVECPDSTQ